MLNHHQLKLIFGVVAFVIVCVIVWRVFFPSDTPETGVTTTTILPSTTSSPGIVRLGMGVVVGIVISVLVLGVIAWKLVTSYLGKTHKSLVSSYLGNLPSSDPPVNTNPKTRLSKRHNSLPPGGSGTGDDRLSLRRKSLSLGGGGAGDDAPSPPSKASPLKPTRIPPMSEASRAAITAAKSDLDKAKLFFTEKHKHFADDIIEEFSATKNNGTKTQNSLSEIEKWLKNKGENILALPNKGEELHKYLQGAITEDRTRQWKNNK